MKEQLLRYSCLWLSLLLSATLSSQEIKVIDENNVPLIGVHVFAGQNVMVTDLEGNAFVSLSAEEELRLEYLGYKEERYSLEELIELNFLIQLQPDNEIIDEVIIIGRTDARELDLPYNVTHIKAEQIFSSNAQNSADALALNSGAYVQKSQLGGGSPILRGFEANKVLLVVDGIRMNNAIYRNGHLQNAITIDPAILQQMEVIYGPGSLLYGSEALGGVIHFRTQSPLLDFSDGTASKHRFNIHSRYNSADQEKTIHVDHMLSKRKFGVLTSVSYTDRGDLRSGANRSDEYPNFGTRPFYVEVTENGDEIIENADPNVQIGTAYNQLDILQKYVYQVSENLKTELNLQYSTSGDIPRYDNLSEYRNGQLRFAEWYYGPQKRLLIAPKFSWTQRNMLFDKASLISSYQQIEESRYSRNLNATQLEAQIENVSVLGLTIDFNKRINLHHKLTYGADLHYNDVGSQANAQEGNLTSPILTRYPSGSSQLRNAGAYIQHNWQNTDSTLVWATGIRYSNQEVNLLYSRNDPFQWPDYFYDGIVSKNSAVVGITGINYQKGPLIAKVSTGTAFRSPNVDDLAKIRVNGDEITVPNPDLDSEKVWNSEITLGYRKSNFTFSGTAFYTQLTDAIVRETFTLPDGSDTYFINNDSLIVTANVNSAAGTIRGLSLNLAAQFSEQLAFEGSINIQKGIQENAEGTTSPLGHIPPTYGRHKLTYALKKVELSLSHNYNAWKRIEDYGGSVDNPDLATIDGAPSWHTFSIASQWNFGEHWTINLALENLTDLHYRPFASGVSAAGRHVVIAARYGIGH